MSANYMRVTLHYLFSMPSFSFFFFFFNDTATTEIYTLSLHDALPISLKEIVYAADEIGVKYLTVYGFSTENWVRPTEEVDGLMELMLHAMRAEIEELMRSEEHTSELQSPCNLVCRLLLEKKNTRARPRLCGREPSPPAPSSLRVVDSLARSSSALS